jgi:hypothetical protein
MATAAFEALRETLAMRHRESSLAAFTQAGEAVLASGLPELDAALGGGFPRGAIATLEGAASAGRSTVAARLLAQGTAQGLAAAVTLADGAQWFAPALAAAGVRLERLTLVPLADPRQVARAADILLRSNAFGVVVIPALPGEVMRAAVWTRLAALAHHAGAVLLALASEPSSELRYFASVRVALALERVQFAGPPGPFCALHGFTLRADVRKHKRAAPGARARVTALGFDAVTPVETRDQLCRSFQIEREIAFSR